MRGRETFSDTEEFMRKSTNRKSRNIVIALVVGLALIAAILACSLDWSNIIPSGTVDEIISPPAHGSLTDGTLGDSGAAIGSVPSGHTPTGTAITNANKDTLRRATSGNYYLAEDITGYGFNNLTSTDSNGVTFNGTLDGNGHSITVTGGSYSYQKTAGGVFGVLESASAVVKNLTVIYDSSITLTNNFGDKSYFGVGLVVGQLKYGTIQNVKVKVNAGVTISVTGGNLVSLGGFVGQAGSRDSSAVQKIERSALELNGTLNLSGGGSWVSVGGIVGYASNNRWVNSFNVQINQFVLSGSGVIKATGGWGKRASSTVGAYESYSSNSNKVIIDGLIYDMTNSVPLDGDRYCVGVGTDIDSGSDHGGTATVNYVKTPRAVERKSSNGDQIGSLNLKGTLEIPSLSGITLNEISYDAEGYITFVTQSTRTDFLDFIGTVNGTQTTIFNNWKNYKNVNVRICPFSTFTGSTTAALKVAVPEAASNSTQLLNALKQGRSVSVNANMDMGATAFEVNIEYKGMIIGNNKTITFTGASSSVFADTKKGGLVKVLNGASVNDLTLKYGASMSKGLTNVTGDGFVGLLAGHAYGGTEITNVKVDIENNVTITTSQSFAMNFSCGGILGLASGEVTLDRVTLAIGNNAKLIGGGGGRSSWTWTSGIIGNVNGTGLNLTMNKIAVYGKGSLEGQSTGQTNSKRVAGLIGGIRGGTTGAITLTDYVYALNTLNGDAIARVACYDGGTPSITLTKYFYADDGVADFHNVGSNNPSVSSSTSIAMHPYDKNGQAMTGIDISVTVNADFTKLNLDLPAIEFDPEFMWSIELKSGGSVVLDSATLFDDATSYTLSATLQHYDSLGVYMKQSRSVSLPSDANMYEHGYVPSGYAQQQGYYANDEWTEINTVTNGSMLATLSGEGKYFLTEDITVAGFVSRYNFAGVLDGCGHTITLINSGGAIGVGLNGNLGGLFAELTGIVKNVRVVVKTSVASSTGITRFGLLAGRMDTGAKLYNVKVSYPTGFTAQVSIANNSAITMGGIVGLVEGSDAAPVEFLGVTMELNGELRATGEWSWMGGIAGRVGYTAYAESGTKKLVAKQVVFRGDNGNLNNVDVAGDTTERTAGFATVGGYGTSQVCTLDVDGFIFEYAGKIVGQTVTLGAMGDSNVAKFTLKNAYRTTSVDMTAVDQASGSYWYAGFTSGATSTNESVVESAFTQNGNSDSSLGYTVALFDPAAINTSDGTVNVTDSLILAAIFEDSKENQFFVADIEIIYGSSSKTGTQAVSLVNIFKLTPTSAFDKIIVQIRSGSASDGVAGVDGSDYTSASSYTDGWLTDNGRVPPMVGVPTGATAISTRDQLMNWLEGKNASGELLATDSVAYLYGYLAVTDIIAPTTSIKDRRLAAGRTLDGMGKEIVIAGSGVMANADNYSGWMTGSSYATKLVGELVTVNSGTIKNLTMNVNGDRPFTVPAQGMIYGVFAAVNEGIIENCKTNISSGTTLLRSANNCKAVIFGGIAGVNRGTIRYATIENNSTVDLSTSNSAAAQKIAGGIAGVNDGGNNGRGTMEYLISSGSGSYTIANAATYKSFLGGIVGYARISSNAPTIPVGATGAIPAQGIVRNVLHNFAGTFKTGGSTVQGLYYGPIAGYIMPSSPGSVNPATGWFAGVKNGASNTNYFFFQENGTVVGSAQTLQYQAFSGGDSGITNANYGGGGVINVTYDGTANSVANNSSHHFWWDYWGGTGELRYEVYNSATVNQMTVSGTGATVNSARGTAAIKNTATKTGAPLSYAITTTFYNNGSYYDYLNGIKNYGKAATPQTTSGTDLAGGWFTSSGQSRLSGSGNFYLSSDVTVDVSSIADVAGVTFSGTFDGNGHTITITGNSNGAKTCQNRSHFGILTDVLTGTFKNVKIVYNATFQRFRRGGDPWTFNTGILTGECSGTIENVSMTMATGSLFISSITANGEGQINRTGVLCGGQTGGTISNCSVDYGTSFTMKSESSGGGGSWAGVCYRVGLIGEQSGNASLTNLLIKGTASFHGYQSNPRKKSFIGAIVGYQPSGCSISNLYLDNMTVTLQQDNAPTWGQHWGDLTGETSDGVSGGSVSNVYLIGTNQIKSGTATGGNPTPTKGVVSGTFFGSSLDAMLAVLQNAKSLVSQISNGVNGMDTSDSTRNLFVDFADYKISNFSAGYKLVLRYPELGYYITSLLDGSTQLTTANAESTYGVSSIALSSKIPSEIAVGIRAKVALIYNKVDENGNIVAENTSSNIVTQDYTGRNTTAYEFRPVAWGDGTTGSGSTVAFSWNVGGKITSGRVPTDTALTATMAFHDGQYAYWNPSANATITVDKVQFSGTVNYQILKVQLEVDSDTGGEDAKTQWKDRGLLTFRLSGQTFDSAMNQVVYSLDSGVTWRHVLKCNNYQNGQATVTISFESQRGGSRIRFRAYDGISQVSFESEEVTVRVDTSYPVIEWEENSEKLSSNQTDRYLVVDDVSSVDLGKEDDVLTISGPHGHNLDYELTDEWRTHGKIRVFVNGDVSDAISGNYTFTVKDALGRTRSVTETLDFTPPIVDASVTYAEANGKIAINNPETTVSISLTDNYTSSENLIKTLKAYFVPKGQPIGNAIKTLSVADGTIITSGFNTETNMGNVLLSLPDAYHNGLVDIWFEAIDDAGNVRQLNVLSGRDIILDTREYTLNVKRPSTDENPYELNGLSYRINGSSYTAIAGEGDILHILRARLFDTVEIVYTKKAGYTYDGYQLVLGGGQTLGTVPQGTQYVLGAFSQEDLSDDNNRTIVFLATQELKIGIPTTASGLGALKNGNYSDTINDYKDPETGASVLPNFLNPTATVFTYSTESGDYTDDAKFNGAVLKDYFDITLTDPNGQTVTSTTVDGVETLTFVVDPDSEGLLFIEGSYTLQLSLKEGLRNKYTVLEGATATFTVSAKSRRAVVFTYPGETLSYVYNGEQNLLDQNGNIFVGNGAFQPWTVDFASDAFDEEEWTEADGANLEKLRNGLNKLNYTLYGNGVLIGSQIGGAVTGKLAISDVGTYYLTVSIPITGAVKFTGVTGTLQIAISVTKKTVDVYAAEQSVMYGDAIDANGYTFQGLVASDTKTGNTDNASRSDVKDGVMTSFPRVSTEYSAVRVVNGMVAAYKNGAVLTGGLAKNYNFVLHSADLTIVPRDIILKISDSRKTYGESDPNLAYWGLSDTETWTDDKGVHANKGFGYSDNYLAFLGSEFKRDAGEDAGSYSNNTWTQYIYKIYGVLTNPNYNIHVEEGEFRIARRELIFNITGDQGLIFEDGITHSVSAKIANALTKDNLTVAVEYVSGNWSSIGTHYYRLIVSKDNDANSDALFANYTYNQANIPVVIGASILNIVVLPQVLVYGSNPNMGEDWYILEGIKAEDKASVKVTLNIPIEYQKVGYHAGAISAEVTFTSANVNYTPIVRKGNLTVIPQSVELNWSGDFNSVYTGDALDKRITATVKTATSDPLQVTIAFSSENGSASPRDAGNYTATASLTGSNSENYVVTAKDRTRQFIVQKSEQRISVSGNYTYNPETTEYPTFNAERQYAADYNGELVYRARINYLTLLSVAVNTATGYRPTTARIPSITVYSLTNVSVSGVGTNGLRKFTPGDLNYFELEAGTYTAVAELAGDNNHYSNAYLFTFVVRETQNKLSTSPAYGNFIDTKTIQGSYVANTLGETVTINDDSKLGYTVGPNTKHREVEVKNGSISRLMADSLEGSYNGSAYNTLMSDGYYGSHDGDWAYAYFNISVSEQLRQQILQGKVNMQIDLTAASMSAGIKWYKQGWFETWTMVDGAWREDVIDTTNLSFMVREISSADDIAPDAADASWIGLDDNPYNINSSMMKYGQTEGFNVVSNGVELLQPGELSPYAWWDDGGGTKNYVARHVDKSGYSKTITLTKDNVKSGSAFRVYLISSTLGATRASTKITGDLGQASRYLGNKRNNFLFEGISVKFVENTNASPSLSSDKAAPQVSASLFQDTATKGMKYRFDIRDDVTGIDFSSVSATVGGIKLTPGNGLNLVVKDYTNKSNSPILSSATFETGVISTASDLGEFTVKDYAGNRYRSTPSVSTDKIAPTLGDVKLSATGTFDSGQDILASETFWYNKKQYLSVSASDNSGGTGITDSGIYYYDEGGNRQDVDTTLAGGRIVTTSALPTGLYYIYAEDREGNLTVITFNLLVDESAQDGTLEIVLDPNLTPPDGESEGSWQKGNVVIENTVTSFGNSFGRMYYATSATDFKDTYQTDNQLQWFAMDVELRDGELILSETITTATKKYYAFKYVAGAASYPGANDNVTVYKYYGLIMIDREEPSITAESYKVSERNGTDPASWAKDGLNSAEWTNNDVVFEISGTTGLSKGQLEYTLYGVNAEDSLWYRPGDAGYEIYYWDYVSNSYTQTFDETRCFSANNAGATSFDYKAYLLLTGQNTGNVYAFRFRNGAGSEAVSSLGVTNDGRDSGFRVAIDRIAPEVTSINSSWQPNETKSQIYIRESDSGVKSVTVYQQRTNDAGDGIFQDGAPVFEEAGYSAEKTNGRWYYTFKGVYYRIVVEDVAGNIGENQVKLKIDTRDPTVSLDDGAPIYSNRYVAEDTTTEEEKLGSGVWAYRDANGVAYIEFKFTVSGGISGYTFAYSTVGFTSIESEWIKPGGIYDQAELDQDSGGYTHSFTFRLEADRAETYLFRFTSGAQKSVYFNFSSGSAEPYQSANENLYNYRVNIDATPATAENFEFGKDTQWLPLAQYDDSRWVTEEAVAIRFTASEHTVNHASTGIGRVTYQKDGDEELTVNENGGYYIFYLTETKGYTVRVYDKAGNVTEYEIPAKNIDLVAPVVNVTATTESNGQEYTENNPTKDSVRLSYEFIFGDSGIASIGVSYGNKSYTKEELEAGILIDTDFMGEISVTLTNGAGKSFTKTFEVQVDKTKPTAVIEGLPDTDTVEPVQITIKPQDENGSGVKSATLSYDENGETQTIDISGEYTFTVRDWRKYTVTVEDFAGNVETISFAAKVDATVPENFSMTATTEKGEYVANAWSTSAVTLTFNINFQSVSGTINYGNVEYRKDGGEWETLFYAGEPQYQVDASRFCYVMEGEINGVYEFRATTLSGNVSAETAVIDRLMIDTVTPELNAVGLIGGEGGAEFEPHERGYTWISADVEITFTYLLGHSGGTVYEEFKSASGDAYVRRPLFENLTKDGQVTGLTYTVKEEGFYRFVLRSNADNEGTKESIVDYGEIRRDEAAPTVSVSSYQRVKIGEKEDTLVPYTPAMWTKNSVVILVQITLGVSYRDSMLYISTGDSLPDFKTAPNFSTENAELNGEGRYLIVYHFELSENQMLNYDFRMVTGAGVARQEELRRSGGAVRIDKNTPELTIESVKANGVDYANFENDNGNWMLNGNGWTNQNVTFTFKVRTYLSGGTLKYTYDGLAGYTSDNIASYGSSSSGVDGDGNAYTERRYTLTLSGENFAINAEIKFRVESGSGVFSNDEADGAKKVTVKIDKTRPMVDENSITKTPNVPANTYTEQDVIITFSVYDQQIASIASGVKTVEFGKMSGSIFAVTETLTAEESGKYKVTVKDNDRYLIRVTDEAGNASYYAVQENVDKTEPVIQVNTEYAERTLSTSPIAFNFQGSVYGVSGAKAQYRLNIGEWIDAADVNGTFLFNEMTFEGTLSFRLLTGAGVASAEYSVQVVQDLTDYRVDVVETVVVNGSYSQNINFVKNGNGTAAAPLMKKGEALTLQISEKAEFPLYEVYVNGNETEFMNLGGRQQFEITVSGDTKIELKFREIISVTFDTAKLSQSIRVIDGKNTPVTVPFSIAGEHPGFEYRVKYQRVTDEYGNPVEGGVAEELPQTLGTYRILFESFGEYTRLYQFSDSSSEKVLKVYYFDKVEAANVTYYDVRSAYDLRYIRYSLADGIEFRQTRDLTVTREVAAANGGDWTVGDLSAGAVYNGANYKIVFAKMDTAAKSLFGNVKEGATVKNVGLVMNNPILNIGTGESYAALANSVSGTLRNAYVTGSVRIAGQNASVGGVAVTVNASGVMTDVFSGLKIDVTSVGGDYVTAAGIVLNNSGSLQTVFSAGSVNGKQNFMSGNMVANDGEGTFANTVSIESTLYSGTNVLESALKDGVTVVKYWDLNDTTKNYWDTVILSETLSPKAEQVDLKHLVDGMLNGLTFETDENNNRYIPVSSYEQLTMIDNFLWADYRQTADIDVEGRSLTIAANAPFTGNYDGKGYVIANVSGVGSSEREGYGMFGYVTGKIENVVLKELNVQARIASKQAVVGGLVQYLVGGVVKNVSVGGSIVASVPNGTLTVGGVVGRASAGAQLSQILNTVSVTTEKETTLLYAGSIVGVLSGSRVENVYSIAKVDAYYTRRAAVGQLIGAFEDTAETSYADYGYSVIGVTYLNGAAKDAVVGYDVGGAAKENFSFISFGEMMDANRNPYFTVNGKHVSLTLKTLFPFQKGTGIESDPFEIRTAEEFLLIGNYLYAYYNVMNDIDFGGNFETIGKGMKFTGSIAGVNSGTETIRKLSGLTGALVDQNYGRIQSLELQTNVTGSVPENTVFGAAANENYGTVSFVKANGRIELNGEKTASLTVGGLVGKNYGVIEYSNSNFIAKFGTVDLKFGGVAGISKGGTLFKNVVDGSVNATVLTGTVGMFAGVLDDPTCITRQTNTAGVEVDVFLKITVNKQTIDKESLYGVKLS